MTSQSLIDEAQEVIYQALLDMHLPLSKDQLSIAAGDAAADLAEAGLLNRSTA